MNMVRSEVDREMGRLKEWNERYKKNNNNQAPSYQKVKAMYDDGDPNVRFLAD